MQTLRDTSIEVIKSLPQTCSMEEIMYQINLTAQVLDGLKDEQEGKTISTDELLKRLDKWQQK